MLRSRPRVVLLGAGHAHLPLLASRALARADVDLVCVTPGRFHYSGLATGVLGGAVPLDAETVDEGALVACAGGRRVADHAVAVDRAAGHVVLADGPPLPFDLLSLDVGSVVPADAIAGAAAHAVAVKPLATLGRLRRTLEARFAAGAAPRVVVVGGGLAGCEVAANVAALARRRGGRAEVMLLARASRLAPAWPAGAAGALAAVLARAGVEVRLGETVTAVEPGVVHTAAGRTVAADVCLLATGLVPPPLAATTDLACDPHGALVTDACLRAPADPRIFGAGDCIAFAGRALPRVGVYAVRQAPVLRDNLAATLDARPLRRYRPQRRTLLVVNCGDGTGLALWGRFWWHGRLAAVWKTWLDRRFLGPLQAAASAGARPPAAP